MEISSFFMYKSNKQIKVDYWQMGLLYYIISASILIWQAYTVYGSGDYLLKEPIIGSTNPFAKDSTYDYGKAARKKTEFDYCKGASASSLYATLDVGDDFVYSPNCETLHKYEVSSKRTDFISFTTSTVQWETYGWPCSDANGTFATTAAGKCTSAPVADADGEQCACARIKSFYPTAVENFTVNFAHGYSVGDLQGRTWRVSSLNQAVQAPLHPLDTKSAHECPIHAATSSALRLLLTAGPTPSLPCHP